MMAEFAASVIAIVSAGTKITLVLSKLGSELGSAGTDARMIAAEIRSFCGVLKTLEKALDQVERSPYYAQCQDIVSDMTLASTEMFADVLDVAESVQHMTAGATRSDPGFSNIRSARQRMNWGLFKKPKILMLRASLESYKSTMVLLLGTIDIAEKSARRVREMPTKEALKEEDDDQVELESLKMAQRDSLLELEAAKACLTSSKSLYKPPPPDPTPSKEIKMLYKSLREEISSLRSSVASVDLRNNTLGIADRAEVHNKRATLAISPEHDRLSKAMSMMIVEMSQDELPTKVAGAVADFSKSVPGEIRLTEDPEHGERVMDMMAAILDANFKDELSAIEQWYRVLSEPEKDMVISALAAQLSKPSVRFYVKYFQYVERGVETDLGAIHSRFGATQEPLPS